MGQEYHGRDRPTIAVRASRRANISGCVGIAAPTLIGRKAMANNSA
jgi:hypothetical protein